MAIKVTLENEIRWPRRVHSAAEAVKYIDATGYCMLFPVNNVPLPSLYYAVTRRNPHAEMIWDKYSAMVWGWKDELPHRRRAYYAKYFRGRGTFISLKLLPHFLATREATVAPIAQPTSLPPCSRTRSLIASRSTSSRAVSVSFN